MQGDQRLAHIDFRDGTLFVPKEKTVLQKLLSIYHTHKDKVYYEFKPAAIAAEEIDILEYLLVLLVGGVMMSKELFNLRIH